MRTRKEIKGEAKELLKANFDNVLKASLFLILLYFISGFTVGFSVGLLEQTSNIANILTFAGTSIVLSIALDFIATVLSIGLYEAVITKDFSLEKVFKYFKNGKWKKIILVYLLMNIFIILWAFIPLAGPIIAIIKGYGYSMALYLFTKEEAELTTSRSYIKRSLELMDGHKLDYLLFNLSFIPWLLLTTFTFGLAYIWVFPYIFIANVIFFEDIYYLKN